MNRQNRSDLQHRTVWADRRAQEALIGATLQTCADLGCADRDALIARIDQDRERLLAAACDARWRESIAALIERMLQDLRGGQPLEPRILPVDARELG
jgi:hypothetical protein